MARPTLITVYGQFLKVDGTPEIGTLVFQSPVYALHSSVSEAIVPSKMSVALDAQGNFEIDVPATNDPSWVPQGWKYRLTLKLTDDYSVYEVSIPYDSASNQLSIAQLLPTSANLPVNPANYAPLVHTHTASDIVAGTIAMARLPVGTAHNTVAYGDHTHAGGGSGGPITIDDVTGLQSSLDGKANAVHTHAIADVTGLQTTLNTKADSSSVTTALGLKVDTSALQTVAFSGSYTDLTNKPTIPTIPVTSVAGKTGAVTLVKSDVGLTNVDNTADTAKPVSTAQQTALNLKADTASLATVATSGSYTDLSNKPTIPVTSVASKTGDVVLVKGDVGLGNVDNTSDTNKPVSSAAQTALNLKANIASPTFTGTVSGITKAMVGLGNVDNTSDTAKPISTATQTALDAKSDSSTVTTLAGRVTAVEDMTPVVLVWNGTAYAESTTARLYVGPNDPGTVPDGSVWIDTDA
jgi:hypothetical protein